MKPKPETEQTAEETIKWALRRLDWYEVSRLADALVEIGTTGYLREVVKAKRERAKRKGKIV
jgi:hypothetical protein